MTPNAQNFQTEGRSINRVVRHLEERVRELERHLGRKTLEVESLREALDKSRSKKPTLLARSPLKGDFQ
jgi:transposase